MGGVASGVHPERWAQHSQIFPVVWKQKTFKDGDDFCSLSASKGESTENEVPLSLSANYAVGSQSITHSHSYSADPEAEAVTLREGHVPQCVPLDSDVAHHQYIY